MIKTVMCVRYLIDRKGNGLIFPYLDTEIRYDIVGCLTGS